jgi:glycosyltransferase involved in cell wall biosynthesis
MLSTYFPIISVIIAVRNGAATLARCLQSVFSQSYELRETIVMDGGSTDGSVDILETFSNSLNYWESSRDNGIYNAWNKALKYARGDWVCFLGSDDIFWSSESISCMVSGLQFARNQGIRLVYGSVALIDPAMKIQRLFGQSWRGRESLSSHQMPPHPGLLHDSQLFKDHGFFDERFKIAGDYEFMLRELKHGKAHFVPDKIIIGMQNGGKSNSIKTFLRLVAEDVLARKKHNFESLNTCYLKYYMSQFRDSLLRS